MTSHRLGPISRPICRDCIALIDGKWTGACANRWEVVLGAAHGAGTGAGVGQSGWGRAGGAGGWCRRVGQAGGAGGWGRAGSGRQDGRGRADGRERGGERAGRGSVMEELAGPGGTGGLAGKGMVRRRAGLLAGGVVEWARGPVPGSGSQASCAAGGWARAGQAGAGRGAGRPRGGAGAGHAGRGRGVLVRLVARGTATAGVRGGAVVPADDSGVVHARWRPGSGLTSDPAAGTGPGLAWVRLVAAPYRAWAAMWRWLAGHGHLLAAALSPPAPLLPYQCGHSRRAGLGWSYRMFRGCAQRGRRAHPGGTFRVRAKMPGEWRPPVCAGAARALIAAPGVPAAAVPQRARRGRGNDPRCPAPGLRPGRRDPVFGLAARAPGRHRLHRHWQDHTAAAAVGRLHGRRAAPVRRRVGAAASAGGARLQGRRVVAQGRRPDQAGAARRGRQVDRHLAGRGVPGRCGPCRLERLVTTLLDLIEHGTGGAAYYTDIMEAMVALAVGAPCGPPASSADFLARLDSRAG